MFKKAMAWIGLALALSTGSQVQAQCTCVQLDGTNEYLHTNFANYNFANFTMEVWVKLPTNFENDHYISIYQNAYLVLGNYGNGYVETWADGLNPINAGNAASSLGAVNTWHHIAHTYDGSTQKIYIDGVQVISSPTTGTLTLNSSSFNQGLNVGARYTNAIQFVGGLMDEVRVWNVARTQAQIQATMSQHLTGSEPGLVGYWPMNDGTGSGIASDLSPNNHDLTLVNMETNLDWVNQCPFAPFQLSHTPNDTVCHGASITLSAIGYDTILWYPATGLNTTQGGTVIYTPSASGTVNAVGYENGMPQDTLSLSVVVLPTDSVAATAEICTGDSIYLGGGWQVSGGLTYYDTYTNIHGCDSVVGTLLTVHPLWTMQVPATICAGDSILLGGAYQTTPGTYTDVLTSIHGCDSTVHTTLAVNTVDTAVTSTGTSLNANANNATYQWYVCGGGAIPGETAQVFFPSSTGSYQVAVTQDGCTSLSGCQSVIVGLENALLDALDVYPNPSADLLHLQPRQRQPFRYALIDAQGRTVLHGDHDGAAPRSTLDLRDLSAGVYTLKVSGESLNGAVQVLKR